MKKKEAIVGAILFPFLWMILWFLLYNAGVIVTSGGFKTDGWIAVSTFISLIILIFVYIVYYDED